MSQQELHRLLAGFRLGEYWIDPRANQIGSMRIYSKSMDVLLALAAAAPNVVSCQTLLERVWSDVVVVENVVHQAVAQLRKSLGDDVHRPAYIESIPRRGYRLIADVRCRERLVDGELRRELRRKPRVPSIAVLPLADLSLGDGHVPFVDGLTNDLMQRLSRIPGLRVAEQAPSFRSLNKVIDYAEVGRALGVAHLLEGSVRSVGKRLRVTMQLVACADGSPLWSADFDRQSEDIRTIQREIGDAVAAALSLTLRSASLELLGSTRHAAAHAQYLRGNALFWHHTRETTERAIAELQRAVAIDPCFARAWVVLSQAYGARARQTALTEQSLQDMLHAAERALRLEPKLWRAHSTMAWYLLSRRRFVAADTVMSNAIRLRRGQEAIYGPEIMYYLQQVGRWRERLGESERLCSAEVVHGANHEALYVLGRKEEARESYARLKGLSQAADREYLHMLAMDQPTAAEANKCVEGFSSTPFGRAWFGERSQVLAALPEVLARGHSFRGEFAYEAMLAAHHGDFDLAMRFLRAEYLVDGFGALHLLWFPQLNAVRATPEFKAMLVELGLPDMWRATGSWGDFCEPAGANGFRCR